MGIEEEVPDSAEDKEGGGASRAARLDKLLNDLEGKLNKGEYKPSIGDFIRLLQLRKEIEEERPREITVTWVEPFEGGNAGA